MTEVAFLVVVYTLTCLSGVGAFVLLWPRDAGGAREFRTWPVTLLVLGLAAPAVVAVPIFNADFLTDNGHSYVRWGFAAGVLTSTVLLAAALVGDRPRGRRRCPRCWYDMAGTGMTCPECGRVARSERALHRSRRRVGLLLASGLPAAAALIPWNALHYRSDAWPVSASNTVITLAFPFVDGDAAYDNELNGRLRAEAFWGWQRFVLTRFARVGARQTLDEHRAIRACEVLVAFGADDEETIDTLITISGGPSAFEHHATFLLGGVRSDVPRAKRALLALLATGAAPSASIALANLMPWCPREPAPERILAAAQGMSSSMDAGVSVVALRWFEPTEQTRQVLLRARHEGETAPDAITSLAALWPRDPSVQALLLEAVGPASPDELALRTVYLLITDDRIMIERDGRLSDDRLALYSRALCDALERRLPELEARDGGYTEAPCALSSIVRRVLRDARAAHAETGGSDR